MKRFISKVLLFSAPILVAAITAEILIRAIPNDYAYKRAYLDQHAGEIETLILGSSHTYRGLNPELFSSNTFNAGYVSQTLNIDYEILKKYQNKFTNLKTIILPISYHTFYSELKDGADGESWRVKNYTIYWHMDTLGSVFNHSEILSIHPKTNIKRLGSYYVIGTSQISCDKLGWGRRDPKNRKDLLETAKVTARKHTKNDIHSTKYRDILANNQQILHSLLSWSKAKNINVLLVTTPVYQTYRQHINPAQYDISVETVRQIASTYANCQYVNLFDDSRFVDTDFHDSDHLNELGAEKLTTIINQRIEDWYKTGDEIFDQVAFH